MPAALLALVATEMMETAVADILAIAIATLAILGPGAFLLRHAWRRGGNAKKFAITVLVLASLLVSWLLFFPADGSGTAKHVSRFIGAWGILFMAVGIITMLVALRRTGRNVARRGHATLEHGARFRLWRGDECLGTIELAAESCDFPWHGGRFEPGPAFAPYAPLFAEELRLLDNEDMDAWGEVLARIEGPGLRLEPADGGVDIVGFQLHIDGRVATWRA